MTEVKQGVVKLTDFAGKYKYILLVIAVGFLLLTFPAGEKSGKEEKRSESFNLQAFEKQVEKTLSVCVGVGRCKVMLSVSSGPESVFAKEARESRREDEGARESDIDTKPSIISGGSGGETPVLIKEMYPEFQGAVVICDGAGSAALRGKVVEAVSVLTGLRSDRISVIKMKE